MSALDYSNKNYGNKVYRCPCCGYRPLRSPLSLLSHLNIHHESEYVAIYRFLVQIGDFKEVSILREVMLEADKTEKIL